MFKHNNYTYIENLFGISVKTKYRKEIKERLFLYVETFLNNVDLKGFELIKFSAGIFNNITEEINDDFLLSKKEEILSFFNPLWFERKIKEKIKIDKIISCFLYNFEHNKNKNFRFLKAIPAVLNEKYSNKYLMKIKSKQEVILTYKEKEEYERFKKTFIKDFENYYLKNASFQSYKDNIKEKLNELNINYTFTSEKTEIVYSNIGYFNLYKIDLNDKEKILKLKKENFQKYSSFYFYLDILEYIKDKIAII